VNVARDLQTAKHGASPEASGLGGALDTPASSDVWSALDRIGKSRTLRRAEKLIHLLNFLVETTLSGNAHYLKETTVGVSVFGRPPDYDPKTDTIVRSQAWRLRAKLRDYYATEGANDSVIIDIAKGQYAATFSLRSPVVYNHASVLTGHRSHSSRK
jgi:hypothetical protein